MPNKLTSTPSGNIISELSTPEIDLIAADRTKSAERLKKLKDAADKKAVDSASGNKKLLDLGLTQAEATALTGYTPS